MFLKQGTGHRRKGISINQGFVIVAQVGLFGGTKAMAGNLFRAVANNQDFEGSSFHVILSSTDGTTSPGDQGLELTQRHLMPSRRFPFNFFLWERKVREFDRNFPTTVPFVLSVGTPGLLISPFVRKRKVTYILHTYPHGRFNRWVGWIFGLVLPESWTLVTVSEFAARETRRLWRLDPRVREVKVLKSGIQDLPGGGQKKESLDRSANSCIRVLCVAACEEYKDPWLWIKVAETVNQRRPGHFSFTWVGGGSLLPLLRANVTQREDHQFISFVGPRESPQSFFQESDVYLQVSKVEALGLSLIEAARARLPAVVTRTGGMPEVVTDRETGFVCEPRNIWEIAEALIALGDDNELRSRLGANARKRFTTHFDYQTWSDELAKLLSLGSS